MHDDTGPNSFYTVDYHSRRIFTQCEGVACTVPFNAAFARAIDCLHRIEDAHTRSPEDMLYLVAYHHYMAHAPIYAEFNGPAPRV